MNNSEMDCELLRNLNKVHTTPMGAERIRKNLSLESNIKNIVDYCKQLLSSSNCKIHRQGKNWYCTINNICITVNAYSFTIITAHKTDSDHKQNRSNNQTDISHPPFSAIKSYEVFSRYYWYREELQSICKSLNIDSSGMKAELNHNIEQYFKGNFIAPKPVKLKTKTKSKKFTGPLTLQTGLIECGFCFNQRFRDFFSQHTGINNFKFNVDMVATVKKVKESNDYNFSLGDLLDIYYGKKTYAKYNKVSLQWNKFVQDFCSDPAAAEFKNKLRIASILWKEVRTSTREKIYSTELLNEFNDIITKETQNAKTKN